MGLRSDKGESLLGGKLREVFEVGWVLSQKTDSGGMGRGIIRAKS